MYGSLPTVRVAQRRDRIVWRRTVEAFQQKAAALLAAASCRRALLWLLMAIVPALFACAMHEVLRSEPGIDISVIKPGIGRADVETVLGAPRSSWTTSAGVTYSVYKYYTGKQPSAAGAVVVGFFDAITLGLFEVLSAPNPNASIFSEEGKTYAFVAVSYDLQERVISVFAGIDEFASLPVDGRVPEAGIGSNKGDDRSRGVRH